MNIKSTSLQYNKYTATLEASNVITFGLKCKVIWAGMVGAVSKISAFRAQGPQFDQTLPRFEHLCDLFRLS